MRAPDRPTPFRKRADLVSVRRWNGSEYSWIVKDPIALRYHQLTEREYDILTRLDGATSPKDLIEYYEGRYAPDRMSPSDATRFIEMLYGSGLLTSDQPGQASVLARRAQQHRRSRLLAQWSNPLAVRFRGLDPSRLFDLLGPIARPLLSRPGLAVGMLLICAAAVLALAHMRQLNVDLKLFYDSFTPSRLLLFTVVLGGVKILHEFGHGLTCRYFGGKCHELGFMLLVFSPCLYCNVTDAWRFPSKWRRAAVGAAGIYVELLLAAVGVFGWQFAEPGLFRQVSFGVMVLCSLSTVVFNGNPLMRYDGYYILSDVLEVPNLAERSRRVLLDVVRRAFVRGHAAADSSLPKHGRGWYATYAVLSAVYRWVVAFSVVLFLVTILRPYMLENLARAVGVFTGASLVVLPLVRLFRNLRVPGRMAEMHKTRAAVASGGIAAATAFAFLVPLPYRIICPLELRPLQPHEVYAEAEGYVSATPTRYGEVVKADSLIAQLADPRTAIQLEQLHAELRQQHVRLESLNHERFVRPAAAAMIPQTEKLVATLESKLEQKRAERKRLTITTPRAGVFCPPPQVPLVRRDDELRAWTGFPLSPENHGATIERGTLLGEIVDEHWEAWIVVPQEYVELLHVGDTASVLIDALPTKIHQGRIEEISRTELLETPRHLSHRNGGEVQTEVASSQSGRPASPSYSVRVRLTDDEHLFRTGWRGVAKFAPTPTPLAVRCYRWAARTFHFHL